MADAKKPATRRNSKAKKPAAKDAEVTQPPETETPEAEAESAADPVEPAADAPEIKPEESTPEPEVESETSAEEATPPTPAPVKKRGGFLPLVAGGAIAAGIGFAAAQYLDLSKPAPETVPEAVQAALEAQAGAVSTLEARIGGKVDELTGAVAALRSDALSPDALTGLQSGLEAKLGEVSVALQTLSGDVTLLEARLTELEKRPVAEAGGATGAAVAAYERELTAMRETLEAQRTQIEQLAASAEAQISDAEARAKELEASAEAVAAAATSRAAMSRVFAALEGGGGYQSALGDLASVGADIPQPLQASAAEGVPTLAELQRSYPDAARVALEASIKATTGDGAMDRLGSFLRTQVGARSLEPKEGDDPDAVLSRAEAALRDGDLDATLALIDALPDAGKAAMDGWSAQANARLAAVAAAKTLAAGLNGN